MTPRMFSFNNPYGACPDCTGLGTRMYLDPELVVPDPELSIRDGAIAPWEKRLLRLVPPDPGGARQGLQVRHPRPVQESPEEGARTWS